VIRYFDLQIWDEDGQGKWSVTSSWKAHSGSIWRVSWAHPEFGQVVATCSFDRTASVWEEVIGDKISASNTPSRRWVRRTTLVDSRTSVTDVEFAPKYLGLLLATASADGIIRIYEAPDIMNLSQWPVQHEIANKLPLSCLSWNTSTYMVTQLLAVSIHKSLREIYRKYDSFIMTTRNLNAHKYLIQMQLKSSYMTSF